MATSDRMIMSENEELGSQEAPNVNRSKKLRKTLRTSFTRIYNGLREDLNKENCDLDDVRSKLRCLEGKLEELRVLDKEILDFLLDIDADEKDLDEEIRLSDEYTQKFNEVDFKIQSRLIKPSSTESLNGSIASRSNAGQSKLKLPTIVFNKFGGDLKDWLPFWAQFKRVDDDGSIDEIDKYHYLLQATVPNSRARHIVESYPATSENYSKALKSLKSRFGREDLQIEVYVRELLKLVLSNLNNKIEVSIIYDKLETQLRALETLGVTTEKCSAMLYPLIESCLPEDVLRAWQRHTSYEVDAELKDRLDALMKFLQKEVANEERITLASSGFENNKRVGLQKTGKLYQAPRSRPNESVPTAAGLVNPSKGDKFSKEIKCMFCGSKHTTENCKDTSKSVEEKLKILGKNGCCFTCTKYGHRSVQCKVKIECSLCHGRHASVVCKESDAKSGTSSEQCSKESSLANNVHTQVFLQTFMVKIRGRGQERTARAIIDTGSQKSYILQSTAKEFNYEILRKEKLIHGLFGGTNTETIEHACYKVRLSDLDDRYACNFDVLDQEVICSDVSAVRPGPWTAELKSLGISITDEDGPIEVLIGADVAGKLYTESRHLLSNGLVAMQTLLGWTLMGRTAMEGKGKSSSMAVTSLLSPIENKTISDLWSLDLLGIKDPEETKIGSSVQARTMTHFLESVSVENDGRYQVKLPWIEDHPPLPSNFKVARKRLDNLTQKLSYSGYLNSYQEVLSDWEKQGIIEIVNNADLDQGHYLPHRHVIKESSLTTKLRPVFDASARERNQPSLNDCLEKGENLIELIPSILNRFRLHRYGVVADIEKAFLQIGVHVEDRDFLRFLWIDEEGHMIVYRHARVVFGVTCSPFMLSAVIKLHLEKTLKLIDSGSLDYSREVVEKLLESFYVDNCMSSFDDFSELNKFIEQATSVMKAAKFRLRGWEYTENQSCQRDSMLTPILGFNWNKYTDLIELNSENLDFKEPEILTKRSILSFAHRLFDPIGTTCPASLLPKILLQKAWKSKIGWDDEVSEELKNLFVNWAKQLKILSTLKVPRYFGCELEGNVSWTIHCFCDASQDAYAAAVFLRGESKGLITVQLVQAKSRVAPVKKMTIPRLELLAASIGVRLTDNVLRSLGFANVEVFYWTDSTTVLSWIQRENNWGVFVWNRVREIRSLSKPEFWCHVPGHLNPADLPSRGCSPKQLVESKWWEGPSWLQNSSAFWPNQTSKENCDEDEINSELRKSNTSKVLLNVGSETNWYYQYFSQFEKIVRLVGWIVRFCNNTRNPDQKISGDLTVEELGRAQNKVFKLIQQESFPNVNKEEKLKSLCLSEDDNGLLRLKTKIISRPDSENFKFPIVLPSKHSVVHRYIQHKHEENSHVGVQGLLSLLREEVWILSGRRTVKSVIDKCIKCKRHYVKSLDTAPVPLPSHRIRDAIIFEVCGVDLAGPLFLRNGQKAWITLFTCAVYRAVHLELVTSLSTDSFLQSLRRFIARRGRPLVLTTDNGTNFHGAHNAFNQIDWNKVVEYSSIKRMEWKFNPPASPWWGGWWERLIRLLKQLLRRVLGKACLNYDELFTILCECESVINNRPLTYLSEDSKDMEVLTPAMFLNDQKEYGVIDLDLINKTNLTRRWNYKLKLKEDLTKRFRIEYLGQLMMHSKKAIPRPVQVGEIVLLESDNSKRTDWPLAKIEKTFPGKDGNVRLVEVKTEKGRLLRPVQRLCPLEIIQIENNLKENDTIACQNKEDDKSRNLEEGNIDTRNEEESNVKDRNEDNLPLKTRRGRQIKIPRRYRKEDK